MKKKVLALLLIGLLALSLTVFAACNMDARRNRKNSADSGSTSEHEHDYDTIVVPPTCEEKGFTTYVCKICGFAYAGDYVDATGHDWNGGEETTPATFDEAGETTYTCTVCGKTKTEELPQLLHTYSEEWSSDDESHWHACTDEGYGELKESEAAHIWNDGEITTAATCEAAGETTYTCTVCGETKTEPIAQLVHDYAFDSFEWDGFTARAKYVCTNDASHLTYFKASVIESVTTPPTCTETGVRTYTAFFGGYTDVKTEEIAALGHDKVNHEAKAATCTEKGWNAYETCTRCDYSTYEEIAALVHNYVFDSFVWTGYTAKAKYICSNDSNHVELYEATVTSEVTTAPTCTATGVKVYTASYDGHTDTKNETLAATGHNYVYNSFVWDGYTAKAKYICSHDGEHIELYAATVTSEVTTAPTCTATGVKTYTATYDGHSATKTETLSATGHDYVYNSFVWDGYTAKAKYVCSHNSQHVTQYDATVTNQVTTQPTCEGTGVRTYTASYDGHSATKTKTLSALGHDKVDHAAKAATCTEKGWNAYETCTRCDYTTYEEIPAFGHAWNDGEIKIAATCEAAGETIYTCTACGKTRTEVVDALGHDVISHEARAATCRRIGWDYYETCSRCDYSTYEEIPALGHDGVYHAARAATCTRIGWNAYKTCTRCDYTTYEEIPALGHKGVNHEAKEPTCTEIGWNAYKTCTRCDYTTYEEIAATGHDYAFNSFIWDGYTAKAKYICSHDSQHVDLHDTTVTNQVTTQPTCTATGVRTYTATYDGHSATKTKTLSALGHNYSGGVCTRCGEADPDYNSGNRAYVRVDKKGNESATGGYILFGEYPQTVKANSVTITSTTDSRGYYLGSDGAYYAKVAADPCQSGYKFSTGAPIASGSFYYFKVEPIKWRILDEEDGTATILCEMIIDAHAYQSSYTYNSSNSKYYTTANGAPSGTYANNYEYSEIRKWLNENFYETAFSELERGIINTVQVDNCYDKAWLMSKGEITSSWKYVDFASDNSFDIQRRKQTTDYARANNAYAYTLAGDYYGNGWWWLRAPDYTYTFRSGYVYVDGIANDGDYVYTSNRGVVPALKISLNSEQSGSKAYVRVDGNGNESATGGYILFGEYPQTVKADDVTITDTTDSRGYYLGSDGAYYAKVTANPYENGYKFTTGATTQSGTVYYFKVEPIKWRILEDDDGTATILCEMIIDAHRFDDNSNNYKESEIRAWLNNNFYNTAFSELERGIINTVQVDNSAKSTMAYGVTWNGWVNNYACEDTYDKVWLMSEEEITKSWKYVNYASYGTYDTQRRKRTTDYAKANYALTATSTDYYGNGCWWLRSPNYSYSYCSWSVFYDGYAIYSYGVDYSYVGVVPALQITL